MLRTIQRKSTLTINQLVERIMETGKLSRPEHIQLTCALLGDGHLTDEDRRQINRILDYLQIGRLKIVDQRSPTLP